MIINATQGGHELMAVKEFIIMGFPDPPEMQSFFFFIFLLIYPVTVTANITITGLVWMDRHLHTPMYFFLGNFSFMEVAYVSTTVPKLLSSFLNDNNTIPFTSCIVQMYFFSVFGVMESFLLVVMSYDRYLAICCPLRYTTIMNFKFCTCLLLGCWSTAILAATIPTILVANLHYCGDNKIYHFLCESISLFKLSCSDTTFVKTVVSIMASTIVFSSFIFIMISYTSVIITILRMPSHRGKQKAFSTCTAHLTAVIVFYLTVSMMYVRPSEEDTLWNQVSAVLYAVVIPCLNPFIYSLRNKDMKESFQKLLKRAKGRPMRESFVRVVSHEAKERQ